MSSNTSATAGFRLSAADIFVLLDGFVKNKMLEISVGTNDAFIKHAHLRCDGIFSDSIITNFLLILTVK